MLCDTERTIEENMVESKGKEGQYSKSKAKKVCDERIVLRINTC